MQLRGVVQYRYRTVYLVGYGTCAMVLYIAPITFSYALHVNIKRWYVPYQYVPTLVQCCRHGLDWYVTVRGSLELFADNGYLYRTGISLLIFRLDLNHLDFSKTNIFSKKVVLHRKVCCAV